MLALDVPPALRPAALARHAAARPARPARPATAVGVGEREFVIAVYRPRVHAGRLKIGVRNLGEDGHDLAVRRAGHTYGTLATVRPGATGTLRLTLRHPGRYTLVCTLADHAARGMRATLRVIA
jgi:plastocyanin